MVVHSEEQIQAYLDSLGVRMKASQFVGLVSNAYHEVESAEYDRIHLELADARPVWEDCLARIAATLPRRVRVLDVGAGTGFASEVVLRVLGDRVSELVCLDPSDAMLRQARVRLMPYATRVHYVAGEIHCVHGGTFDLITTNSVLHHVLDLSAFLAAIRRLLGGSGVFVAGHEPCRGFYERREVYRWTAIYRRWREVRRLLTPSVYIARLRRRAGSASIEEATNASLVQRGVLERPLPPGTIRQLVDIHVPSARTDSATWGLQGFRREDILGCDSDDSACVYFKTYSHVKDARARMGGGWRAIERWLARRYPASGSNLLMAVRYGASGPTAALRGLTQ